MRWLRCAGMLALLLAAAGVHARADVAPTREETQSLLRADRFAELDRRFSAVQRAYRRSEIDDGQLRAAFRVFYPTDDWLEPKFAAWVQSLPKSYVAHLARGHLLPESRASALRIGLCRRHYP